MENLYILTGITGAYGTLMGLGVLRGVVRPKAQNMMDILHLTTIATTLNYLCCPWIAAVIVVMAMVCFYDNLPSPYLATEGKAVFVTGCDRGLGQHLAVHLDSLGLTVFAGCLFPGEEGERTLKEKCSPRLRTMPLDVSDLSSVKAAADFVKKEVNGKELWGVVNNAGIMQIGCLEVMTLEDVQRLVDVNYTGQVQVVRAFLPLLRKSRGRLVNVASNTGMAPVPFHAPYCASKAAVAAMTESLRLELAPFGVKVSTIIPSGYHTGIMGNNNATTGDRWWSNAEDEVREAYGKGSFYPESVVKDPKSMLNTDFSGIVHKMADALFEKMPKDFYYKGFLARSLPFLYLHTPTPFARLFYPTFATWYKFDPPGGVANMKKGASSQSSNSKQD